MQRSDWSVSRFVSQRGERDLLLMLIDSLDAHRVNHVFSHDLSCLEGYPRIVRTRDDLSHKPRAKQLKEIAKQIASYASKKVRKHFS